MTTTSADSIGTAPLPVRVFVSHSHRDKDIVEPLVELLQRVFRLTPGAIRATSVDGAQLSVGSDVRATIVDDLREAEVTIAVVTPASLESTYVQFELAARSAAQQLIMPVVVPGVFAEQLPPQLRGLHWVFIDTGIRALIQALATVLKQPIAPPVLTANRARIGRIVEAARHRYAGIAVPLSFEQVFGKSIPGRDRDPGLFWSRVVLAGAELLVRQVTADINEFQPDLILALNQGGMVTCGLLKRWLGGPVGVAFTGLQESRAITSLAIPDLENARRVLLVDTKLKSGTSVLNVITALQARKPYEFRLAVLVDYGPWAPPRWTFPNGARWPAMRHLSGYDLPTYVAYRTSFQGQSDPYLEPWRNDSLVPGTGSAAGDE